MIMKNNDTLVRAITLTGFVFGVIGFVYIAGNAWFHPESLAWPLTHFMAYPREDTFGAFCFLEAMICFFIYNLIGRGSKEPKD
jgi:hypothetical protein